MMMSAVRRQVAGPLKIICGGFLMWFSVQLKNKVISHGDQEKKTFITKQEEGFISLIYCSAVSLCVNMSEKAHILSHH